MKTAVLLLILLAIGTKSSEIPSFLHVCRRYDPKLTQCLAAAVEGIRPSLATGVPEYGIPSIEPLLMANVSSNSIGVNLESDEIKAYGCSDFFVRKIRADIDNQFIELDIELPRVRIITNYTVLGRFLILPLNGTGTMDIKLKDSIAKLILKGELYERNGEKFLKFVECQTKFKYARGFVDLGDIFGRASLPNYVLNHTANKHFDAFAQELLPMIEQSLSISCLNIANKVVKEFTFRQLFPHN